MFLEKFFLGFDAFGFRVVSGGTGPSPLLNSSNSLYALERGIPGIAAAFGTDRLSS